MRFDGQRRPKEERCRDPRDAAEPVLPGRWRRPLRGKAPQPTRGGFASMTDDQLLRYSRHILLDEMGIEGQERVLAAHALIIGVGGLGSPAALFLAGGGVGHITLVDDDVVDLTNLQRQIAHTTARVGRPKVESAAAALAALNPQGRVTGLQARGDAATPDGLVQKGRGGLNGGGGGGGLGGGVAAATLDGLVQKASVVLDCSDNYATRHAINAACVRQAKPLVAGAVLRFDGQLTVLDPRDAQSPCYACIFAPDADFEEARCATMGVFAPLVGVVGALQAAEALKLLAGIGQSLAGRLWMLDGRSMRWNCIRVQRSPGCTVCAPR